MNRSSSWVYNRVLERMASVLEKRDAAFSQLLANSTTDRNGGYLDLRQCSVAQLRTLLAAADEAYAMESADGAAAFALPEFYPGFMARFDELRERLRARIDELDRGTRYR